MAIFHCSVKTVSRSAGRSALGTAAYRAGVCLEDARTGEVYDYRRKQGVEHTELVFPFGVNLERNDLWNGAEQAENRKNSTVAREYELALPAELTPKERLELARAFAQHLVERYGVAADVAIHAPGKGGDLRNHHAHILTTTRQVTAEGFGAKTRVLDDKKTKEIEYIRAMWKDMTNHALERAGHETRVDHRSLAAQGLDREPTAHIGPTATAMERRGLCTERGDLNRGLGENRAAQVELDQAEKVQNGVKQAKARAKAWRAEQWARKELTRQQALAADRAKQHEREQRERLEAERKAKKKERLARELAERREKIQGRGGMER